MSPSLRTLAGIILFMIPLILVAMFFGAHFAVAQNHSNEIQALQQLVQALQANVTECRTALELNQQSSLPALWKQLPWVLAMLVLYAMLFGLLRPFHDGPEQEAPTTVTNEALAATQEACVKNGHSKALVLYTADLTLGQCFCSRCKKQWTSVPTTPILYWCTDCCKGYCGECAAVESRLGEKM